MFFDARALDSFDQYLQDVERYPLIENPEKEREIARRARAGDREAAERLVTANLRFVISYVKKYQGRGLNLAELVCIGNEGLLKAVKKFDPDKGVKFISYAVWWIRQTVLQALAEQTRSVRIPLNQNSNLVKLSRTETALTQKLGRSPTDREIAEEMKEPVETVRALRRVASAGPPTGSPMTCSLTGSTVRSMRSRRRAWERWSITPATSCSSSGVTSSSIPMARVMMWAKFSDAISSAPWRR